MAMEWTWLDERTGQPSHIVDVPVREPTHIERLQYLSWWEQRGRGYQVYPRPVALEPAYMPYDQSSPDMWSAPIVQPEASPLNYTYSNLRLTSEQRVTPAVAESFVASLDGLSYPIAFEILADSHEILYQMACVETDWTALTAQLELHFPDSSVVEGKDHLRRMLEPFRGHGLGYTTIDLGLHYPFYQPLKQHSNFAVDPLSALVGVLAQLRSHEVAGLQVLMTGVRGPWATDLRRVASDAVCEIIARPKISGQLFATVVRLFAVSRQGDERAFAICQALGTALGSLTEPGSNWLIALSNEEYPDTDHFRDLLVRQTRRPGMLLADFELAGIIHPPTESLQHPKLQRLDATELPLPGVLQGATGITLGNHRYRGQSSAVVWPDGMRNRHCYVLGATRMGKSTLLLNMVRQDMDAGRGLCLIDPHGDLARDALAAVPDHRTDDVYYLDLSDRDYPVAMGLLEAHTEWERELLSSDIVSIFHRLFTGSWGDRLEHILRHVILTLLSLPGHTLRDLRLLLTDRGYRDSIIDQITDPDLRAFWTDEFAGYTSSSFAPLYNKVGLLLSSPLIRNIVGQKESRLDIGSCMANRRIVLVNLSQGLVGEDNAAFLGAFLVSKIQIAAMQTLRQDIGSRVPFTLYADEFQHFVVTSFEKILTEAGKAGLELVMANQFLSQLSDRLQQAVLGNIGALVGFRVGPDDARRLEREFGNRFAQEDILSLERGQAIVRMGAARDSFCLATMAPLRQAPLADTRHIQRIIAQTRSTCCRARSEVEAEIETDRMKANKYRTTLRAPNRAVAAAMPSIPITLEPVEFGLTDEAT